MLRYPNAAFLAAPVLASLFERRRSRAAILAVAGVLAVALLLALTSAMTGTALPYKAMRSTFGGTAGFPVGEGAEPAFARFETHWARNETTLLPRFAPAKTAYAAAYFLLGRHTGVLVYLPFAAPLFLLALRRGDAVSRALLASVAAVVGFYLVWMPDNFFGGGTAVGNRYFLAAYPALLLAPRELPTFRHFLFAWSVALVGLFSALYSVLATSPYDRDSQSHASFGIFRLLPYESTAPDLEGRRDRYWSGDFVRFTDPFAEVADTSFTIHSDHETEILIASRNPSPPVVMLAADAPGVVLEYRDWWQSRAHRLVADEHERVRAVATLELAQPWRHHPMWWSGEAYDVRVLRLRVRSNDGRRVGARVRYLGDGAIVNATPARRVLSVTLPGEVVAGSSSTIPVRVQNLGGFAWSSTAPVPITFGYRLTRVGASAGAGDARGVLRTRLATEVPPGGEAHAEVRVAWPTEPGRYQLRLDLVLEGLAWFEERVGEPLALSEVEVVSAP